MSKNEPREFLIIGNGAEPFEYVDPVQFKPKANAFYEGPILRLKEKVRVIEKSAYEKEKARADRYREALVEITRDKEGFPGAECLRKVDLAREALKGGEES